MLRRRRPGASSERGGSAGAGRAAVLWRETLAVIAGQRVTSMLLVLLVAGATATTLVTAGRSAGVESAVLSRLDQVGTRSLTVYAQGDQPALTSAIVTRLARFDVVESVVGFGPAEDVTAAATPAGTRVAMRTVYGRAGALPAGAVEPVLAGHVAPAWATSGALRSLGFPDGRGVVRQFPDGAEFLVTGQVALPAHLGALDPVVLVPGDPDRAEHLAGLVVVADTPQDLALVSRLVTAELVDVPADGMTIESAVELADLRAAIGGELTAQNRGIILGVLAASAAASTIVVWTLVMLRRRDFGRRRALGATRQMIVGLTVAQVLLLASIGSVSGSAAGVSWLVLTGRPVPAAAFVTAVALTFALSTAVVSAIPGTWAARRDPLVELRVP